jgi:HEXXH motif-containing protein
MGELVTTVRRSLEGKADEPWWPGLAQTLAKEREPKLPFKAAEYSTSRFLGLGSPMNLSTAVPSSSDRLALRLEVMEASGNQRFADRGLEFVAESHVIAATGQAISAATSLICLVPSLALAVSALVRSVHILKSDDPGIDISFSDPSIPFSIFLSVSRGKDADLRIAEAIIHETMHLQLSLVEQVVPLVLDDKMTRFSPWKQKLRPLSGLIHALYVFRVIDRWLERISASNSVVSGISRRREQIAEEIAELDLTGTEAGFTQAGQALMCGLLRASDSSYPTC